MSSALNMASGVQFRRFNPKMSEFPIMCVHGSGSSALYVIMVHETFTIDYLVITLIVMAMRGALSSVAR